MLLWFTIAVLLAVTIAAIILPLVRGRSEMDARAAYDANIFKDQLKSIDRDLEEGLIDNRDAEAARLEISRKLLAAAEQAEAHPLILGEQKSASPVLIGGLSSVLAAAALGLYFLVGSPAQPDLPLQARLKAAPPLKQQRLTELVARAEQQLQKNPSDARGWEIMAPIYMRHNQYAKAVAAYKNVLRLRGPSSAIYAALADALVFANEGVVPDEAVSYLQQALKADPALPKPKFWLSLHREQNEKLDEAVAGYTSILKNSSEAAPWRKMVQERLDKVLEKQGKPPMKVAGLPPAPRAPQIKLGKAFEAEEPAEAPRGPTREDVEAAQEMSPQERKEMIENMVAGLAERLNDEGGDLQTWMRLVNAYNVLGKKDDAKNAIGLARKNLQNDQQAQARLDALARRLGLGS